MMVGTPRRITEEDREIGRRIRGQRVLRNLSQQDVAEKLGISFQQVQKYEKGVNRVSGARLVALANLFETSTDYLMTGGDLGKRSPETLKLLNRFLNDRQAVALMHAFLQIRDPAARRMLVQMAELAAALKTKSGGRAG